MEKPELAYNFEIKSISPTIRSATSKYNFASKFPVPFKNIGFIF